MGRLGSCSITLLLCLLLFQFFGGCKTVDQSTPSIRFEIQTKDTVLVLTNDDVDKKIDISGDPINWKASAYDLNRIQTISFYYRNLRMEFPNGLEGVDTVNNYFTVGGQTIGQLTFNFVEYHSEATVSGVAFHDVDSRAILKSGSFYHIKAVDLDAPQNHVSPSLSLTIE